MMRTNLPILFAAACVVLMFAFGHQAGRITQPGQQPTLALDFRGAISTQPDQRLTLSYWSRIGFAATTVLVLEPLAPKLQEARQALVLGLLRHDATIATASIDLTMGPLAGEQVRLRLVAVPERGGPAILGGTRIVKLPVHRFYHPLARKLITLRRELLQPTPDLQNIATQLDALSREPDVYDSDRTIFAALRSAVYRLRGPEGEDQALSTAGWLWQIALDLDGDTSVAAATK